MQIVAKYRHQLPEELITYSVYLVDSVCNCSEDGTENATILNWNGESVSGDLPEEVLNGVSALITITIQEANAVGLFLV